MSSNDIIIMLVIIYNTIFYLYIIIYLFFKTIMPIAQYHTKQEYSIEYFVNDKQPVVLIGVPEAFLA